MADIESLSNPSYPSTLSLDNQSKQKALRTTMIGKEVALVHEKYHDSNTLPMVWTLISLLWLAGPKLS